MKESTLVIAMILMIPTALMIVSSVPAQTPDFTSVVSAQAGELTTISQRPTVTFGKSLATGPRRMADTWGFNGPAAADPYILNGTITQPSASFNISGTGTANILNIETQLNSRGHRAFMIGYPSPDGFGGGQTFAGLGTGTNTSSNTIGNSFF